MTFDAQWYLQQNQDVADAKAAAGNVDGFARTHYDNYGRFEGRQHAPTIEEVVTSIYNQSGRVNPVAGTSGIRVMTNNGSFYDVNQVGTGLEYERADGPGRYKPAMVSGSLGLFTDPAQSVIFGNRYHGQPELRVGQSFNYQPDAPTEFPNYVPADQRQAAFTPTVQGSAEPAPALTPVAPLSIEAGRRGQSAGDAGVQIYGGGAGNRVVY